MIQNVLPIVIEELNDYLKSKFNAIEDKAILSGIVDQEGKPSGESNNKIIASLVLIDKDTTTKSGTVNKSAGQQFFEYAPPVSVNLTIMFSAFFNHTHYLESLRYISGVIYFFQHKPLFTAQNTPKLSKSADKLYFDLLSVSPQEMMNIYSMLGAKYMPSVIYKMKMLTFAQDKIVNELPAIRSIDPSL